MNVYKTFLTDSLSYTNKNQYITEMMNSHIWKSNDNNATFSDVTEILGDIYDAAHISVKGIAIKADLSSRYLSERFCIPYSTMDNWITESSICPLYVKLMLQECLGLYNASDTIYKLMHALCLDIQ